MALTKVFMPDMVTGELPFSMIEGAPINVLDYDADPTGVADSYAAFNSAWLAMKETGGILYIPPGTYLLNTAWTCEVSTTNPYNYKIIGYGATIKTGSAVTGWAMNISRGYNNFGVTVEGLSFDQRDNTNVSGAIQGINTTNLKLYRCVVEVNDNKSGYAAFQLSPRVNGDVDTCCFWTVFDGCTIRQRTGNPATYAPSGIKLVGQQNATTITNCSFASVIYAVIQEPDPVSGAGSNGNRVLANNFEGVTYAVTFVTDSFSTYTSPGWTIAFNRVESTETFIVFSGPAVLESADPVVAHSNYLTTGSVTNYIINPNNQLIRIWESSYYEPVTANNWGGPAAMTLVTDGTGNNLQVANFSGTSSWSNAHFVMGVYHLWVDASGKLRIKGSAPTSDTDGTVVGTQT